MDEPGTVDEAPAGPGEGATAPGLDDEFLARAETALAEYLGPIARVLVKQAAKQAPDKSGFVALLADELSDPDERAQFERSL